MASEFEENSGKIFCSFVAELRVISLLCTLILNLLATEYFEAVFDAASLTVLTKARIASLNQQQAQQALCDMFRVISLLKHQIDLPKSVTIASNSFAMATM